MTFEILMPEVSIADEEVTLIRWLKREGDEVQKGEPVAEIETDKGTIEVEAEAAGTLAALLAREGEAVGAGVVIARVSDKTEQ